MATLRWMTGLLASVSLVCLFFTLDVFWSTVTAAVFLILFLIFCGTFRRTTTRKASS